MLSNLCDLLLSDVVEGAKILHERGEAKGVLTYAPEISKPC